MDGQWKGDAHNNCSAYLRIGCSASSCVIHKRWCGAGARSVNANATVNVNSNVLVNGIVNVNVFLTSHHVTSRRVLVTSRRVASHEARGRGEAPQRTQDNARAARARILPSIKAVQSLKKLGPGTLSARYAHAQRAFLGPIPRGSSERAASVAHGTPCSSSVSGRTAVRTARPAHATRTADQPRRAWDRGLEAL